MQKGQAQAVFDWDQYWDEYCDDLGQKADPAVLEFEYDPPKRDNVAAINLKPKAQRQPAPVQGAASGMGANVLRWTLPAVVAAAFAAGIIAPEKLGLRSNAVQDAQIFALLPIAANSDEEPVQLQVYSDEQHRHFVAGLKRLSDADLLSYAARAQIDMDHAGPMLKAHTEDALTLTRLELDRRNLTAPRVERATPQVLIPIPE